MKYWFWVSAPHYTAGIATKDGKVVEAAPILKWAIGKSWDYVSSYFGRKKYTVKSLGEVAS